MPPRDSCLNEEMYQTTEVFLKKTHALLLVDQLIFRQRVWGNIQQQTTFRKETHLTAIVTSIVIAVIVSTGPEGNALAGHCATTNITLERAGIGRQLATREDMPLGTQCDHTMLQHIDNMKWVILKASTRK